jgi:hypothetical protein
LLSSPPRRPLVCPHQQALREDVLDLLRGKINATRSGTRVLDSLLAKCTCRRVTDGLRYNIIVPGTSKPTKLRDAHAAAEALTKAVIQEVSSSGVANRKRGAASSSSDDSSGGDDGPLPTPRNGEAFLFCYSLTTDAATATPVVPEGWRDDQLLFVFRMMPNSDGTGPGSSWAAVPWAVVGPSAALAKKGLRGRGVYAWGAGVHRGQLIGVYVGDVLGPAADARIAAAVAALPDAQHPYDALVEIAGHVVSGKHNPFVFFDLRASLASGSVLYPRAEVEWPGMFAHLMNDPRGLPGAAVNVCVTDPDGVVVAARDVPPFYPERPLEANAASELLWSYGDDFWKG